MIEDGKLQDIVRQQIENVFSKMKSLIRLDAYDFDSQLETGGHISDDTVAFWSQHPQAYKQTYLDVEPKQDIKKFYTNFSNYLSEKGYRASKKDDPHVVWIRAPHFDDPIVKSLSYVCTGLNGVAPYSHWNVRDIRTAVDMAFPTNGGSGYIPITTTDGKNFFDTLGLVPHDSVDDLCRDMLLLFISLNKLGLV